MEVQIGIILKKQVIIDKIPHKSHKELQKERLEKEITHNPNRVLFLIGETHHQNDDWSIYPANEPSIEHVEADRKINYGQYTIVFKNSLQEEIRAFLKGLDSQSNTPPLDCSQLDLTSLFEPYQEKTTHIIESIRSKQFEEEMGQYKRKNWSSGSRTDITFFEEYLPDQSAFADSSKSKGVFGVDVKKTIETETTLAHYESMMKQLKHQLRNSSELQETKTLNTQIAICRNNLDKAVSADNQANCSFEGIKRRNQGMAEAISETLTTTQNLTNILVVGNSHLCFNVNVNNWRESSPPIQELLRKQRLENVDIITIDNSDDFDIFRNTYGVTPEEAIKLRQNYLCQQKATLEAAG